MEMCRVCLTTEKDMHPLDETFIIQYNLLTNLNITLLDGMPQFSCKTCLSTIKYYIEFRDKCITSEATLREIICSALKSENKKDNILLDKESIKISKLSEVNKEKETLKNDIKTEIKQEKIEENHSILDDFDVSFQEYDSDLMKNLVKDEAVIPKKIRKRKKKKSSKGSLPKSQENILEDNILVCGLCPKIFQEKNELKQHIDGHNDDRQCQLCKEKFGCLSQLLAHRLIHLPIKQLKCHICSKRFKSCLYLEHHYRNLHIESDDPNLQCKICLTKYSTPKKYNCHVLQVHGAINFFCDICGKGFGSKTNLKSHIKQHSKIKAYVCDLCGFSCNYSSGLKDHKIRRHAPKKIYCKNCARPFPSIEDYENHKCKHKLKVCTICGVQLTGSSRLSSHMQRHSDVLKYECSRCPAKYKTKGALIAHNNRHDGNRTKQCEYCPAKFYTATVLIKHRRTHTGERPYVCKICNKGFTGGHNLKVHMKVHGEYLIVKKNDPEANNLNNVTK